MNKALERDFMEYVRALEADAMRYRKLRKGQHWPAVFASHDAPEPITGDALDKAVDAMEAKS